MRRNASTVNAHQRRVCSVLNWHQRSTREICCPAACGGMLQAVGGRYPNFPKALKVAKPRTKHKEVHLPTPCKHERNRMTSWVVLLLLLLLTFPLFVHSIDIHDCQMAQRLTPHIKTIMCLVVSQQTEGPLDMACTWKAVDKKKIDDKKGKSAAYTSHKASLAEVVSRDGASSTMYHSLRTPPPLESATPLSKLQ